MISQNTVEGRMLARACKDVLSYLRLSRTMLAGFSYGSERLLIYGQGRQELYALICRRFFAITGDMPREATMETVLDVYSRVRKGCYEQLRDGVPIENDSNRPLFELAGEPLTCTDGDVATVYAYIGSNARVEQRIVKIGYTAQDLVKYLRSKEIPHRPELIATRVGGPAEEKAEHSRWSRYLADGREWFWPARAMFTAFCDEWQVISDFKKITERAILESRPYG